MRVFCVYCWWYALAVCVGGETGAITQPSHTSSSLIASSPLISHQSPVIFHPPGKLPFSSAPPDDRNLPDMHLGLYENVIVFDQATKLAYVVCWVHTDKYPTLELAYLAGR